MEFKFHNKIDFKIDGKTYTFYNTMLNSVYDAISEKNGYFSYIAIGNGINYQNNYKLSNYLNTYKLQNEFINSDISSEELSSTKSFCLNCELLNTKYITEIGITNSTAENPVIYNYFNLINEDFPNGICIENQSEIAISITIYLSIEKNNIYFIAGNNPFINYILGEPLNGEILGIRGNNLTKNSIIKREIVDINQTYPANINVYFLNNSINIEISCDLSVGETFEIVFLLDYIPFARFCLLDYNPSISITKEITPKECKILDIGENIKNINSITNSKTNEIESTYFEQRYANAFGDKINIPFKNIFNNLTSRFISKDSKMIFFVKDDVIYGYKNINYQLKQLNTSNITQKYITKIISFDNFVFIISKYEPYISAYVIDNNELKNLELNLQSLEIYNHIENILHIDITISNSNTIMVGLISKLNNNAYVIYLEYNESENSIIIKNTMSSNYQFSYILAMYKNNFCDSRIMFLVESDKSYNCRIVTFFANKTYEDINSNLAYYYTINTKELYTKSRAVIAEKTTTPKLLIYYYPEIYEYELPLLNDEDDNYISNNLLYLIQKHSNSYKIYNLVGYNEPLEFINGFPSYINQNLILGFEFLNDILLIFMDNELEPIIGISFKDLSLAVENISDTTTNYLVEYNKYNIVGNEKIAVQILLNVSVSL